MLINCVWPLPLKNVRSPHKKCGACFKNFHPSKLLANFINYSISGHPLQLKPFLRDAYTRAQGFVKRDL